ncbi:hypothetical protein [uncultured Fretibacterium sp.]|uniref:hypothetical protein n=1 Tax=uncultured Fretibacterium sp. TaxID=1678694 RepID=UPI00325FD0CE
MSSPQTFTLPSSPSSIVSAAGSGSILGRTAASAARRVGSSGAAIRARTSVT